MKKLLLTAMLLSSTSHANMYVKGEIGSYSGTEIEFDHYANNNLNLLFMSESTEINEQGIDLNLGLGYQLTDSFAVELELGKNDIAMSYGLGFNVRLFKYNKFSFFTKAGVAMEVYNDDILSNTYSRSFPSNALNPVETQTLKVTDANAMKFNLGIGIEYELNDSFSVYSSLDFNTYNDVLVKHDYYYAYEFVSAGNTLKYEDVHSGEMELKVADNTKMSVGMKYKF